MQYLREPGESPMRAFSGVHDAVSKRCREELLPRPDYSQFLEEPVLLYRWWR